MIYDSFFKESVLTVSDIKNILDIFKNNSQYYSFVGNNQNWIRLMLEHQNIPYVSDIRFFVNKIVKSVFNVTLPSDTQFGDNIFRTSGVYGPHVDSKIYEGREIWKQMVVPLYVNSGTTKFFTFNEHWLGDRASFRYNQNNPGYLVNTVITDRYVDNPLFVKENSETISLDWYNKNINLPEKLPYEIYQDLSVEKEFDYVPGNVIVFDSKRIHGGHNLNLSGGSYKIGMSIMIFK